MSVSALSGGGQSAWDIMRQRRAAMQQMEAAIQSGDIQTAQKSLATAKSLSTDNDTQGGPDMGGGQGSSFRATMKADLSALESAVNSGNLTDAQSALTKLNTDREANKPPEEPGSALGKDLVDLLDSALNGDTEGTQSAAKALQNDLQSLFGTTTSNDSTSTSDASSSSGDQILDDLKALVTAGQGTDASAAQKAAEKLLQDLKASDDQQKDAQGTQSAQHQHHAHHAHGMAQYDVTASEADTVSTSTSTIATATA